MDANSNFNFMCFLLVEPTKLRQSRWCRNLNSLKVPFNQGRAFALHTSHSHFALTLPLVFEGLRRREFGHHHRENPLVFKIDQEKK